MSDKYEFIEGEKDDFPISKMCAWVGVSSSGFYDWRSRPLSATAERREELKLIIRHVFEDSDETYGYRRVHAALARMNLQAGPELVRSLMREMGLVPCQPRPWRVTTIADETAAETPDLMGRDFTARAPGHKLVGDITYIHTWAGFVYLATVIDCHTKAVIGWSMADHMKTSLISDAIDMAAGNTQLADGCVFHSTGEVSTRHTTSARSSAQWASDRPSAAPACAGTTRWPNHSPEHSKTSSSTELRSLHGNTPAGRSFATSKCSIIASDSTRASATRPRQKFTPNT